jgi:hypothetical protein
MRASVRAGSVLAFSMLLALVVSCKKEEAPLPPPSPSAAPAPSAPAPFRVSRIDLGNAVDAQKKVAAPSAVFAPTDTIYASILTEGAAPKVTLLARWTYEDGQVVSEGTEVIAPMGPAATEFHITKPSGWPAGKYQVEVTADGKPAGVQAFEVKP